MYNATKDATRGGLWLGKYLMAYGMCLVDMVYSVFTVDMVVDVMW